MRKKRKKNYVRFNLYFSLIIQLAVSLIYFKCILIKCKVRCFVIYYTFTQFRFCLVQIKSTKNTQQALKLIIVLYESFYKTINYFLFSFCKIQLINNDNNKTKNQKHCELLIMAKRRIFTFCKPN